MFASYRLLQTTPAEQRTVSLNSFRGCMRDVQVDDDWQDLLHQGQQFNVRAGCSERAIRQASFAGRDAFVELWPRFQVAHEFFIGLSFRTSQPDGLIFAVLQDRADDDERLIGAPTLHIAGQWLFYRWLNMLEGGAPLHKGGLGMGLSPLSSACCNTIVQGVAPPENSFWQPHPPPLVHPEKLLPLS